MERLLASWVLILVVILLRRLSRNTFPAVRVPSSIRASPLGEHNPRESCIKSANSAAVNHSRTASVSLTVASPFTSTILRSSTCSHTLAVLGLYTVSLSPENFRRFAASM